MRNLTSISKTVVAFLLLLGITSCKKEKLFQPMDKQVSGNWKFENVTFRKNLSFSYDDLTVDYLGDRIDLKDNKTLSYTVGKNGQSLSGDWELRTKYTYINEESKLEYVLDINVDQGNSFLGTDVSVTQHKLTFYEVKNNGTYIYHFRR